MKLFVHKWPSRFRQARSLKNLTRREILCSTPMLTASLFLPDTALAQGTSAQEFEGLLAPYARIRDSFSPLASVGNVCGRAVGLPVFEALAQAAPQTLLASFRHALAALSNRSILTASSDYLDFKNELAGGRTDSLTLNVAKDVSNDQSIVIIITQAIEHDLKLGQALVNDNSVSISQFRIQMIGVRQQLVLYQAEGRRSEGGSAIYLPVQERTRRSSSSETQRLEREIENLRFELLRTQKRAADLSEFILRQSR